MKPAAASAGRLKELPASALDGVVEQLAERITPEELQKNLAAMNPRDATMATNPITRRLESIQEKAAMRSADVANVLNVRPETVSLWSNGKALPRASTERQLLDLEFIVDKLADIYAPHDARLWLFSRQRLLQDRIPADLLEQGRVDKVLTAINQLLHGVHL
jgi:uncharacterized protein (DUF2384 family)